MDERWHTCFVDVPMSYTFMGNKKSLGYIEGVHEEDVSNIYIFEYFLSNNDFIESLTDDDIKNYFKYFKKLRYQRFKKTIINIFN